MFTFCFICNNIIQDLHITSYCNKELYLIQRNSKYNKDKNIHIYAVRGGGGKKEIERERETRRDRERVSDGERARKREREMLLKDSVNKIANLAFFEKIANLA